jgi:uncharacterized repeat protein (TIGR03803 family)
MKLQRTIRKKYTIVFFLTAVLFLTLVPLASSIVRAQSEPFNEAALPGNAFAGVVPAPNGRLYGLTYTGGTSNKGTLYSVDTTVAAAIVHVNFNGVNGATPYDELTYHGASAKFYGTTSSGGAGNIGTIFSFERFRRHMDAVGTFSRTLLSANQLCRCCRL